MCTLAALPNDVLAHTLSYLRAAHIGSARRTCTALRDAGAFAAFDAAARRGMRASTPLELQRLEDDTARATEALQRLEHASWAQRCYAATHWVLTHEMCADLELLCRSSDGGGSTAYLDVQVRAAHLQSVAALALGWLAEASEASHLFVHALATLERLPLSAEWLATRARADLAPHLRHANPTARRLALRLVQRSLGNNDAPCDGAVDRDLRLACEACAASLVGAPEEFCPRPLPQAGPALGARFDGSVWSNAEGQGELWIALAWLRAAGWRH